MEHPSLIVKVAVIFPGDELLLLRRSQEETRRQGEWDFPGGGAYPDEDEFACALREVRDETGIELQRERSLRLHEALVDIGGMQVRKVLLAQFVGHSTVTLSHEHSEYLRLPVQRGIELFKHPVWTYGLQQAIDDGRLQVGAHA